MPTTLTPIGHHAAEWHRPRSAEPIDWVVPGWLRQFGHAIVRSMGIALLAVAPAVSGLRAAPAKHWPRWSDSAETVAVWGTLLGLAIAIFGNAVPPTLVRVPLEILTLPALLWCAVRLGRRQSAIALIMVSTVAVFGTLNGVGPFAGGPSYVQLGLLVAYLAVSVGTTMVFASMLASHALATAELRALALSDPLTGLANYRRLIDVLDEERARARRNGTGFAVLMLDVDGLKAINDRFGHLEGSDAIKRVGRAVAASCRRVDIAARYGGDEFAVVLRDGDRWTALRLASRIEQTLLVDRHEIRVTVSIGYAEFPVDGNVVQEVLAAADQRLYEAKRRRGDPRHSILSFGGAR